MGDRASRGGRGVRVGRSGRETRGVRGGSGCRVGWVLGRNLGNWNNLLIFLDIFSVLHSNSAIKMQWVNIILIKNTETTLEVMRS